MKKIKFVGVDDLSISIGWNWALLLLSLDLTDRYWSELGLDFEDNGRIRRLIREYVEAEQALDNLSEEKYQKGDGFILLVTHRRNQIGMFLEQVRMKL